MSISVTTSTRCSTIWFTITASRHGVQSASLQGFGGAVGGASPPNRLGLAPMKRPDGRGPDELRPISVVRGYTDFAEGSVLYAAGRTRVLVTASVEERVPDFLRGMGKGWVTAEYSMLPRATETRTPREAAKGRQSGRTQEIQRLIGRSLRAITDLRALGERTVWLDC